jgi:hypothetical protein
VRVGLTPALSTATTIYSLEDAGRFLLDRWPTDVPAGRKHLAARKAVLKAMENAHDRMLTEKARKAFEAAADEAGLLMPDAVKPERIPGFKSPNWRKRRR